MKLNESTFQEIVNLINRALKEYRRPADSAVVTDLHIRPVRESGEVTISDDDRDLDSIELSELSDIPEENFYIIMENELRRALQQIDAKSPMDKLAIWKPFTFVLVDDENETITELMVIDEDTVLASQTLMEGLDADLENILSKLLSKYVNLIDIAPPPQADY